MRKLIISALIAATAMPLVAQAQTAELKRDRQDIRMAQRYGDRHDVRDAKREYREDWQDYRRNHRDVYRRPTYVGPRGYVYRPVAVGARLGAPYYASRYVISDPYRYRLPKPTGVNRWVRYGNDVLLVNVRTGRVIEAHRAFFW
ncbi:RcnB family protein [Edaphosphingomonas haloaromaticamans]|uniref:Nickel/cobalt transporter regulator n=1 Tax=Edaphosphingomonas haloaromaticamans TaxID=653954 RepID=A0A1S1HKY2_9SPHN|nr:RcnB family protein [Sphingomonas haloaromaticamans]OHT22056.1 hypothetical protein BHE75_04078 [Sphingomonas haloaromaticamans]